LSDLFEQCDLSLPACSRCRRLGHRCEYLISRHGQVFINRNMTNPSVNAVDIFSNKDKAKLPENSVPIPVPTPCTRHNDRLNNSIPKALDPGPVHRLQLLSKFIEIYLPKAAHGVARAGQTPSSWVHMLPNITLTNSAYNTSLAALCVAQLGIWNHDPVLVRESSHLYSSALGELRKTIGGQKLVAPEATLASIVILSTYQVSLVPAKIRTESKPRDCSSSLVHQRRVRFGCTSRVVLAFYSFLDQASMKLLLAVNSSQKYEPSV
jgi:hypothetical protein